MHQRQSQLIPFAAHLSHGEQWWTDVYMVLHNMTVPYERKRKMNSIRALQDHSVTDRISLCKAGAKAVLLVLSSLPAKAEHATPNIND